MRFKSNIPNGFVTRLIEFVTFKPSTGREAALFDYGNKLVITFNISDDTFYVIMLIKEVLFVIFNNPLINLITNVHRQSISSVYPARNKRH